MTTCITYAAVIFTMKNMPKYVFSLTHIFTYTNKIFDCALWGKLGKRKPTFSHIFGSDYFKTYLLKTVTDGISPQ